MVRSTGLVAIQLISTRTLKGLVAGAVGVVLLGSTIMSADARNLEELLREQSLEDCVPAKARLAFVRDLGGSVGNEIFTVRPDGRGLKRLTDNNDGEWGPAWSPDGTRIAFTSTRDGSSEIYVMDRTGREVTRLTDNGASDGVAWSPDGTKIAFSSSRDDPEGLNDDLYVIDDDGGNVRKVVGGPAQEWNAHLVSERTAPRVRELREQQFNLHRPLRRHGSQEADEPKAHGREQLFVVA